MPSISTWIDCKKGVGRAFKSKVGIPGLFTPLFLEHPTPRLKLFGARFYY